MSSMLKKSGGLSFKPKAPRRRTTTTSTAIPSASTTRVPTAEPHSQSTAQPSQVPSFTTPSVEERDHGPKETTPAPGRVTVQTEPTPIPPTFLPALEPTIRPPPPTIQNVESAPPTSSAAVQQAQDSQTARPTPAPDASHIIAEKAAISTRELPDTTTTTPPVDRVDSRRSTTTVNAITPEPSSPPLDDNAPPTAPPSPRPFSDTISVIPPPDEPFKAPNKIVSRKRKALPAEGRPPTAEGSAPKKKRQYKKRPATNTTDDEATPTDGEQGHSQFQSTTKRRRNPPIPEDAQNQTVNHATMTMGELTKDLGIGQRFKHADRIEECWKQTRVEARLKRIQREKQALGLLPPDDEAGSPSEENEIRPGLAPGARHNLRDGVGLGADSGSGVGYDIIDGQIIINQQSLVLDRHAAHQDTSMMETVEEDDFTNLITSASFMRNSRRMGANFWSDDDTEKFYRLLKMFGTDFESISHCFPGRNRRAVKLKFNREERLRPNRINAAVMVRGEKKVGIDIEEYKASQRHWQERDKILADHAKLFEEQNQEVARLREERRAQGLVDDDDENVAPDPTNKDNDGNDNNDGQDTGAVAGNGDGDGDGDAEYEEEIIGTIEETIEA